MKIRAAKHGHGHFDRLDRLDPDQRRIDEPMINIELLPPVLREMVRVLGESAAFKLVEHLGGRRLIVPKRLKMEDPLLDLLGGKAFAKLVNYAPGSVIELPKYDSVTRQLRHERVRACRALGMTGDRTATETGYTRRQVMNIWAAAADDDRDFRQGGLWEVEEDDKTTGSFAGRANDPFGLGMKGNI